jgi:hypothetical protein
VDGQPCAWIEGAIEMHVVGEYFNQEHLQTLHAFAEKRAMLPAWLVPEPENPHDSNAVRVDIAGAKAGYIAREEAGEWQAVIKYVEQSTGSKVACRATLFLTPGRRGEDVVEVILHLPPTPPKSAPTASGPQPYDVKKPSSPSNALGVLFVGALAVAGFVIIVVLVAVIGATKSPKPTATVPPNKPAVRQSPAKTAPPAASSGGIFKR